MKTNCKRRFKNNEANDTYYEIEAHNIQEYIVLLFTIKGYQDHLITYNKSYLKSLKKLSLVYPFDVLYYWAYLNIIARVILALINIMKVTLARKLNFLATKFLC